MERISTHREVQSTAPGDIGNKLEIRLVKLNETPPNWPCYRRIDSYTQISGQLRNQISERDLNETANRLALAQRVEFVITTNANLAAA